METLSLETLLLQFQVADNEVLGAAETELARRTREAQDGLLGELVEIFQLSQQYAVRAMCAILIPKRINDNWSSIPLESRLVTRDELLQLYLHESDQTFIDKLTSMIIAVFKFHLDDDGWPSVIDFTIQSLGAEENIQILGMNLFCRLLEAAENHGNTSAVAELHKNMSGYLELLTSIFSLTTNNPRLDAAIDSLGQVCAFITVEDAPMFQQAMQLANDLIPSISENQLESLLESNGIIFVEPLWKMKDVFSQALNHICDVAVHPECVPSLRNIAWSVVGIGVKSHMKAIAKMESVPHLIELLRNGVESHCEELFQDVAQSGNEDTYHADDNDEDDEDGDNEDPFAYRIFEILHEKAPVELYLSQLIEIATAWQESENPFLRRAACELFSLGVKHKQRKIRSNSELLHTIMEIASRGLRDSDYRVQIAAALLVAQIAEHCEPQAQDHHEVVMEALLQCLASSMPTAQESACIAMEEFLRGMSSAVVAPYLESIMSTLTTLVSSAAHEAVLSCLASVADAAGETFGQYLDGVVDHLGGLVTDVDHDNYTLSCQAMDTIGKIVKSLPAAAVQCHMEGFVQASLTVMREIDEPEVKISAFSMYEDFSGVVGEDFSVTFNDILPNVYASATIPDHEHFGESERVLSFGEDESRSYAPSDDEEGLANVAIDGLYEVSHAFDLIATLLTNCPVSMIPQLETIERICAEVETSRKFSISYVRGACMNVNCALAASYMAAAGITDWEAGLPISNAIDEEIMIKLNSRAKKVLNFVHKEKSLTQTTDTMHFFNKMVGIAGPYLLVDNDLLLSILTTARNVIAEETLCQRRAITLKTSSEDDDTQELLYALVEQGLECIPLVAQALGQSFQEHVEEMLGVMASVLTVGARDKPGDEEEEEEWEAPVFQRATVLGGTAEIVEAMGTSISEVCQQCFDFVFPYLYDGDDEVHGNALHAVGFLVQNGNSGLLSQCNPVLEHLETVLSVDDFSIAGLDHILDNAIGCYGRILKRALADSTSNNDVEAVLSTLSGMVDLVLMAILNLFPEDSEPDEVVDALEIILQLLSQTQNNDTTCAHLEEIAEYIEHTNEQNEYEEPDEFMRIQSEIRSHLQTVQGGES
eukprot:m.89096 g.89096  ORF g.89096 m.89096 type:complete len:1107 (-) comp8824_c0_seq9:279-3599(-)